MSIRKTGEHKIKWVKAAQMYCETWFESTEKKSTQKQRWFSKETL